MLYEGRISDYLKSQNALPRRTNVVVPRVQITSAPTSRPLELAELKDYLRLDDGNNDDLNLTGLLDGVISQVEGWMGRALIQRTLKIWLDAAPERPWITLPYCPVRSVTGVTYFGDDDVETDLPSTVWIADSVGEPARIALRKSQVWPVDLRTINALAITYVAGYADAGSVPKGIKEAIKMLCAHYYEGKGAQKLASQFAPITEAPMAVQSALMPWTVPDFADY